MDVCGHNDRARMGGQGPGFALAAAGFMLGKAMEPRMGGWIRVPTRIGWHKRMAQGHILGVGRMTSSVRSAMLILKATKFCRGGGVLGGQISAEHAAYAAVRRRLPL